jgi:hypothetical protein
VTGQTHPIGNLHAAENELSPAAKSMNVEAMSDAKFSSHFQKVRLDSGESGWFSGTSGTSVRPIRPWAGNSERIIRELCVPAAETSVFMLS